MHKISVLLLFSLILMSFAANAFMPSYDDDIAEFYDDAGEETETVPESRNITVSVWLNKGTKYNPTIAVKR